MLYVVAAALAYLCIVYCFAVALGVAAKRGDGVAMPDVSPRHGSRDLLLDP